MALMESSEDGDSGLFATFVSFPFDNFHKASFFCTYYLGFLFLLRPTRFRNR